MRRQKLAAAIAKQALFALLVSFLLVLGGIGVILLIQFFMLWGAARRRSSGGDGGGGGSFFFFFSSSGSPLTAAAEGDAGGLGTEALQRLPCFGFAEAGEERSAAETGAECAVCLESFEAGEVCRLLPACAHSFHARCVDTWLVRSSSCPVCRTPADTQKSGAAAAAAAVRKTD